MFVERRKHVRARLLRQGTVVFRNGYSSLPCVVLDLSPAGARIQVGDWLAVPEAFELRIRDGVTRLAEVSHRAAGQAGLRFIDGHGA